MTTPANTGLIYYVEDDQHIRDLAAYALRQAGFEVRTFPDGAEFASLCAHEPPDAVLLDIMLPGDDGLELLRQLRENGATAAIPVMMLTAKGTEFDTVCGLDAGAGGLCLPRLCRREGAGKREARPGDRRRRRPQPLHGGPARIGQVHAGPPPALHPP